MTDRRHPKIRRQIKDRRLEENRKLGWAFEKAGVNRRRIYDFDAAGKFPLIEDISIEVSSLVRFS